VTDAGREAALEARHLRLACRLWGPPDGEPTLALHGWLDNAASFDLLAPLLPRLRICALDLPGHGRSQHRPAGVVYHFVDYVADVLAAADALGWSRFILMGHSLGAGIATLVSAIAPERVSKAVLIEGLGPQASPGGDAAARARGSAARGACAACDVRVDRRRRRRAHGRHRRALRARCARAVHARPRAQ
jgi:pimeloyl-ACP methyl ester carboxylesterase